MTATFKPCTCAPYPWDPFHPFAHKGGCPAVLRYCRACGEPLQPKNEALADGCPCNSPRGVNHGLVRREVCTCKGCDPPQTGASRVRVASVDPEPEEGGRG